MSEHTAVPVANYDPCAHPVVGPAASVEPSVELYRASLITRYSMFVSGTATSQHGRIDELINQALIQTEKEHGVAFNATYNLGSRRITPESPLPTKLGAIVWLDHRGGGSGRHTTIDTAASFFNSTLARLLDVSPEPVSAHSVHSFHAL